jgi:hypothetical protein
LSPVVEAVEAQRLAVEVLAGSSPERRLACPRKLVTPGTELTGWPIRVGRCRCWQAAVDGHAHPPMAARRLRANGAAVADAIARGCSPTWIRASLNGVSPP